VSEDLDKIQPEDALWPVAEVSVRGLFGERDFTLPLDSVVTVLTGENGSGKSTLLKAISLIEQENWGSLPISHLTAWS
jgi:predicted ATPase